MNPESSAVLPNFLIVGTQKSGTTTLAHYLQQHDQIFMPRKERRFLNPAPHTELHFFSEEDNYRRGLPWYERHFAGVRTEVATGEKSVAYAYHPQAPRRIYEALPEVKLVWSFRNPADRAYSQYWHHVRLGLERLSFEEAVQVEHEAIEQISSSRYLQRSYLQRSRYVEQVERFQKFFPVERMHFILFEELRSEPARVLTQLFRFLGVEDRPDIAATKKRKNTGSLPRSILVQYVSRQTLGYGWLFQIVRKINQRPVRGYPEMKPETRRHLEAYFAEPNQRLGDLTRLDVNCWNERMIHADFVR